MINENDQINIYQENKKYLSDKYPNIINNPFVPLRLIDQSIRRKVAKEYFESVDKNLYLDFDNPMFNYLSVSTELIHYKSLECIEAIKRAKITSNAPNEMRSRICEHLYIKSLREITKLSRIRREGMNEEIIETSVKNIVSQIYEQCFDNSSGFAMIVSKLIKKIINNSYAIEGNYIIGEENIATRINNEKLIITESMLNQLIENENSQDESDIINYSSLREEIFISKQEITNALKALGDNIDIQLDNNPVYFNDEGYWFRLNDEVILIEEQMISDIKNKNKCSTIDAMIYVCKSIHKYIGEVTINENKSEYVIDLKYCNKEIKKSSSEANHKLNYVKKFVMKICNVPLDALHSATLDGLRELIGNNRYESLMVEYNQKSSSHESIIDNEFKSHNPRKKIKLHEEIYINIEECEPEKQDIYEDKSEKQSIDIYKKSYDRNNKRDYTISDFMNEEMAKRKSEFDNYREQDEFMYYISFMKTLHIKSNITLYEMRQNGLEWTIDELIDYDIIEARDITFVDFNSNFMPYLFAMRKLIF